MKEFKVKFKTLTPLWTGDAWGENNSIQPSSIMGSLRFWFEVICYFAGITNNGNYNSGRLKDDLKSDEFKEKLLKHGASFEGLDNALAECKISLPSRVFGCTGWKGWVRVKGIEPIEDYCFGNKLNLPFGVAVKKDDNNIKIFKTKNEYNDFINQNYFGPWREKQKVFRRNYSIWYLANPYFYGQFTITFEVEEEILEPIFYPLLTFIERYGFLGGKWNIGYGRVKIKNVKLKDNGEFTNIDSWEKDKFIFSNFYKNKNEKLPNKDLSSLCKSTNDWNDLENNRNKIIYFKEDDAKQSSYKEIIKELIKIKASHRHDISDPNERHNIFGEGGKNVKGTKIIPWIYEEDGQLKGGFVSIAGMLNSGGQNG